MANNLGEGSQPHVGAEGSSSLREQGPHLADGPGDSRAVHAEPAGQSERVDSEHACQIKRSATVICRTSGVLSS